jgi:hypothetical protein
MPIIDKHDTPAGLRDLPENSKFYDLWHEYIDGELAASTKGSGGGEFYDACEVNVDPIGYRTLVWMAFPRKALMRYRDDRNTAYERADFCRETVQDGYCGRLNVQDEYCEWHVTREGRKITKVTFVTETPEYWQRLWNADPACVVKLYQKLVSAEVRPADLVSADGTYNKQNPWNTDSGIVHFILGINNLNAALSLAQGSATSPDKDNYESSDNQSTSVDPRVPRDVGTLVRKGLSVTLRGPIGIYIAGWDDTGWTKPDGTPVGDYWRIVRGRPGQVLRLDYEVPASEGFAVGDIRIGGRPIQWGGQIAEHVTVSVGGLAGKRHADRLAWLRRLVGGAGDKDRTEGYHEEAGEGRRAGRREG